jgi:hypothetical protein
MAGINFINCFYKDLSKMLKLTDPSITDDDIFAKLYEKYSNLSVQEKAVFEVQNFKSEKSETQENTETLISSDNSEPDLNSFDKLVGLISSVAVISSTLNGLLKNLNNETEMQNPYINTLSQVIGLISKASINWTELLSNVDAQNQVIQPNQNQTNHQPQQNQFSFELNPDMDQNSQIAQITQNALIKNAPIQMTPSTQNLPQIDAADHLLPISVFNPCVLVPNQNFQNLPFSTNIQPTIKEKLIHPTNHVQNWLDEVQSNMILATVDSAAAGIQQRFQSEGRNFQSEIKQHKMQQAIQQASNFSSVPKNGMKRTFEENNVNEVNKANNINQIKDGQENSISCNNLKKVRISF